MLYIYKNQRVMKRTTVTLLLLIFTTGLYAQGIVRNWYGTLNVPGHQLHLVFHITKTGDAYSTTMDSPDQHANGLGTDNTTVAGNSLTIVASKFSITYTGTFVQDSDMIKGTFKQGGGSLPLILCISKAAGDEATMVKRPQDPKDFPYKQEEVRFVNPIGKDTLAGTLTIPSDGKASKIVILITGSGPQNRNEELMDHRPFLVWSDWLTRKGIAVLRYDDRGIAKSTGNFNGSTSADFADDAEAAVRYIKSRKDLQHLSIGLMGHSEGGMIAPVVASRDKDVKFIVLLAGPGIPIADMMLKQVEDQTRLTGASDSAISKSVADTRVLYNVIVENPSLSTSELKVKLDTLLYNQLKVLPKADLGGKSIEENIQYTNMALLNPWYRYFLTFNPQDYLIKVKCPVLALDGSLDMQVNAHANLAGIKKTLIAGGNKHVEVDELPGLNHLFQQAKTGSMAEYSEIQETVDPVALNKVSEWINQL
jgi:pimeloyl-ACP methyl ester carboxylesterase